MARRIALAIITAPAAAQDAEPRGPRIDVVFAIDATGSMADEIEQVKRHPWATRGGGRQLLSGGAVAQCGGGDATRMAGPALPDRLR